MSEAGLRMDADSEHSWQCAHPAHEAHRTAAGVQRGRTCLWSLGRNGSSESPGWQAYLEVAGGEDIGESQCGVHLMEGQDETSYNKCVFVCECVKCEYMLVFVSDC